MAIVNLPCSVRQVRLGHRGQLLVASFQDWPNAASLKAIADAQLLLAKQFGRTLSMVIIPAMDAKQAKQASVDLQLPEDKRGASVKASSDLGEELQDATIASALVILPRGVIAVMIRSFVVAMTMMSRAKTPLQVFKEIAPAAAWLESVPGAPPMPELVKDVEAWLAETS